MRDPARILVVDDNETNRDILVARLQAHGYELLQASDGEEALASVAQHRPDLILLDVKMPKLDGFEVCRRLKNDPAIPFTPIILCTARAASQDVVTGLDAGADEYLTKPIDQAALVARVRSMLRIKQLHDQVRTQADDLAAWNQTLEKRVSDQVFELERMNKLKRFLSPQIAKLVLSFGEEKLLESHRRDITAVCSDLRGFTAFAETAEPEDVIAVLREYYHCLGEAIDRFDATLQYFAGDGLLIIFNDPIPCDQPAARAVQMSVEMRVNCHGAHRDVAPLRPSIGLWHRHSLGPRHPRQCRLRGPIPLFRYRHRGKSQFTPVRPGRQRADPYRQQSAARRRIDRQNGADGHIGSKRPAPARHRLQRAGTRRIARESTAAPTVFASAPRRKARASSCASARRPESLRRDTSRCRIRS